MRRKISSSAELLNSELSGHEDLYSSQTDELILRHPGKYYFVLSDDLDNPKQWIKFLLVNMEGVYVKKSEIEDLDYLSADDDSVLDKINEVLGYNDNGYISFPKKSDLNMRIINPTFVQGMLGKKYISTRDKNYREYFSEGWVYKSDLIGVHKKILKISEGNTNKELLRNFLGTFSKIVEEKTSKEIFDQHEKMLHDTMILIKYSPSVEDTKPLARVGINKELGDLTTPEKFNIIKANKGGIYNHHMIHSTWATNLADIIKAGKICVTPECFNDLFDEKSGIFLYNHNEKLTKMFNHRQPGIYMELFEHSKIDVRPPMKQDDSFFHFRYFNVDSWATPIIYGNVGFIYPFEEIFGKYVVSVKADEKYGGGKEISLNSYIKNFPGECVIRANSVSVNKISGLTVFFSFTEIDFIYDKLSHLKEYTLRDVISLYLSNSSWYVRKSVFLKVLQAYGIKNTRRKQLEKLPPIYAVTLGKRYLTAGKPSLYKNVYEDQESDWESFDPNLEEAKTES
jgi:hypothetical protein